MLEQKKLSKEDQDRVDRLLTEWLQHKRAGNLFALGRLLGCALGCGIRAWALSAGTLASKQGYL